MRGAGPPPRCGLLGAAGTSALAYAIRATALTELFLVSSGTTLGELEQLIDRETETLGADLALR